MKVVSVDSPSHDTTFSLYVKAGSRYENRNTYGASTFLQNLAFKVFSTFPYLPGPPYFVALSSPSVPLVPRQAN